MCVRLRAVPPFPSSDSTERGNRARKHRPRGEFRARFRAVLSLEGKGGTARSLDVCVKVSPAHKVYFSYSRCSYSVFGLNSFL